MLSGAVLSSKINLALGKAANAVGFPYLWYRPSGNGAVVDPANLLGTVQAYIDASQGLAALPSQWGKADRFAILDLTNVLAGDYLVGQARRYFVCEIPLIAGVVRLAACNETFSLSRPAGADPGPSFRRGVPNPIPYAAGWPGWLNLAERRSASELRLQGAVDQPNAQIFLPASLPGQIVRGDQLVTSETLATTWTVQGAILSANGWQLTAIRAGA